MKRLFVYACDQMYGGLHGLYDADVVEMEHEIDYDEIWDYWLVPMSKDLMMNYATILESLEEDARFVCNDPEDEEEFEVRLEELMDENIDGCYGWVREDVELSLEELQEEAYNLEPEKFIEKYCE